MNKVLTAAALAAAYAVAFAGPAPAEITNVTATGPGGTVSDLAIGTASTTDDAVQFGASYTSDGLIYFTVTLGHADANTKYYIDPSNQIFNNSAATFPNFYAYLISGPAGTVINGAGQDETEFGLAVSVSPTEIQWPGKPGLPSGEFTFLAFTFTVPQPVVGTETVEVAFGPAALTPVPEPSTWAMMMLGFAGLGFTSYRATRARRSMTA
jgi:hypothetical protein